VRRDDVPRRLLHRKVADAEGEGVAFALEGAELVGFGLAGREVFAVRPRVGIEVENADRVFGVQVVVVPGHLVGEDALNVTVQRELRWVAEEGDRQIVGRLHRRDVCRYA